MMDKSLEEREAKRGGENELMGSRQARKALQPRTPKQRSSRKEKR